MTSQLHYLIAQQQIADWHRVASSARLVSGERPLSPLAAAQSANKQLNEKIALARTRLETLLSRLPEEEE